MTVLMLTNAAVALEFSIMTNKQKKLKYTAGKIVKHIVFVILIFLGL